MNRSDGSQDWKQLSFAKDNSFDLSSIYSDDFLSGADAVARLALDEQECQTENVFVQPTFGIHFSTPPALRQPIALVNRDSNFDTQNSRNSSPSKGYMSIQDMQDDTLTQENILLAQQSPELKRYSYKSAGSYDDVPVSIGQNFRQMSVPSGSWCEGNNEQNFFDVDDLYSSYNYDFDKLENNEDLRINANHLWTDDIRHHKLSTIEEASRESDGMSSKTQLSAYCRDDRSSDVSKATYPNLSLGSFQPLPERHFDYRNLPSRDVTASVTKEQIRSSEAVAIVNAASNKSAKFADSVGLDIGTMPAETNKFSYTQKIGNNNTVPGLLSSESAPSKKLLKKRSSKEIMMDQNSTGHLDLSPTKILKSSNIETSIQQSTTDTYGRCKANGKENSNPSTICHKPVSKCDANILGSQNSLNSITNQIKSRKTRSVSSANNVSYETTCSNDGDKQLKILTRSVQNQDGASKVNPHLQVSQMSELFSMNSFEPTEYLEIDKKAFVRVRESSDASMSIATYSDVEEVSSDDYQRSSSTPIKSSRNKRLSSPRSLDGYQDVESRPAITCSSTGEHGGTVINIHGDKQMAARPASACSFRGDSEEVARPASTYSFQSLESYIQLPQKIATKLCFSDDKNNAKGGFSSSSKRLERLGFLNTVPEKVTAESDKNDLKHNKIGDSENVIDTSSLSTGMFSDSHYSEGYGTLVNKKQTTGQISSKITDTWYSKFSTDISKEIDTAITLKSLAIPSELRLPDVCCVGMGTSSSLLVRNPTDRWIRLQLHVSMISINGEVIIDKNFYCPFLFKDKLIMERYSTEDIKVTFLPRTAGIFVARLDIYTSLLLVEDIVGTSNVPIGNRLPFIVSLQAIADKPQIQLSVSHSGVLTENVGATDKLDFGCLPLSACRTKMISISNLGRAAVPVRCLLKSGGGSRKRFQFHYDSASEKCQGLFSGLIRTVQPDVFNCVIPGRGEDGKVHSVQVAIQFVAPSKQTDNVQKFEAHVLAQLDSLSTQIVHLSSLEITAAAGLVKLHVAAKSLNLTFCPDDSTQPVIIRNAGQIPIKVSAKISSTLFRAKPAWLSLKPGREKTVDVEYQLSRTSASSAKSDSSSMFLTVSPGEEVYEIKLIINPGSPLTNVRAPQSNGTNSARSNGTNSARSKGTNSARSRKNSTRHQLNMSSFSSIPERDTPYKLSTKDDSLDIGKIGANSSSVLGYDSLCSSPISTNSSSSSPQSQVSNDVRLWSVKPDEIILPAFSSSATQPIIRRFNIINYTDSLQTFCLSWPVLDLILTPENGDIRPRSSSLICVSSSSNFRKRYPFNLPWSGIIKVSCCGQSKNIKVRINVEMETGIESRLFSVPSSSVVSPGQLFTVTIPNSDCYPAEEDSLTPSSLKLCFPTTPVMCVAERFIELRSNSKTSVSWIALPVIPVHSRVSEHQSSSMDPNISIFSMESRHGLLQPGCTLMEAVYFTPREDKFYFQCWEIKFKDVVQTFKFELFGQGSISKQSKKDVQDESSRKLMASEDSLTEHKRYKKGIQISNDGNVDAQPTILKFPQTSVNGVEICKIRFQNRGTNAVQIEVASFPSLPFVVDHSKFKLNISHYIGLPVKFYPKTVGSFKSSVVLKSSRGDVFTIQLFGQSV